MKNQNKLLYFDEEHSILIHELNPQNVKDDISYIELASEFITYVEKYQPKNIIIKILKEPSDYDEQMKFFTRNVLQKAIIEAGVKKLAFFFQDKQQAEPFRSREIENPLKAKVFTDYDEAYEWVSSTDN